jgi:hypothetical protein
LPAGYIFKSSTTIRILGLKEQIMCFMLYAGTNQAIPRREWLKSVPDISVASLTEHDAAIKVHFKNPDVQCIGSTSGCGCDFPHVLLQNGEWPMFDFDNAAQVAVCDQNRKALTTLLRTTDEKTIELYGLWWGNFAKEPLAYENIPLHRILEPAFLFREQVFYTVSAD